MDRIRIRGGRKLEGDIHISGAKNAALPLMTASLLTDQPLTLSNIPNLGDISTLATLLGQMGVRAEVNGHAPEDGNRGRILTLTANTITNTVAPYDLVRKMRASVLVLGPLVAREGLASVSLPGGCAIGTRPVDLHLMALEALGAEITLKEGYVEARAPHGLTGGHIVFPKVSVGATENALMAASLARGETLITNAAREPEVVDLGHCLQAMGVEISGLGTDTVRVEGRDRLNAAEHSVVPDRIETGTYAMAAAMTGGTVRLHNVRLQTLEAVIGVMERAGVRFRREADDVIEVSVPDGRVRGVDVMTEPYPGFPTDLQAQWMALMSTAEGAAMVTETIFENRFMHVPEMTRMGADITIHHASALVRGVPRLTGAPVMATDLRASVSLVLAGLVAGGETILNRVYHLDRGYERLEEKLAACGADIVREKETG